MWCYHLKDESKQNEYARQFVQLKMNLQVLLKFAFQLR
jgi:hypothetical protein